MLPDFRCNADYYADARYPRLDGIFGLRVRGKLQWLSWRRGPSLPLYLLLGGWHGALAAGSLYLAATRPDDFRFQGDTLGIDVSLAAVGSVVFTAGALAVFYGIAHARRRPPGPPPAWAPANRRWLVALVALLPVQLALLRFGTPGGIADPVGVVLTLIQWLLVGTALRPRRPD